MNVTNTIKNIINSGNSVYIFSDFHYSHTNLCDGISKWNDKKGCRPFSSLNEMNDTIVGNINSKAKEDDLIIHLGDWAFGGKQNVVNGRNAIKCKNIISVKGNHDHHIVENPELQNLFLYFGTELEFRYRNRLVYCFHYPVASWPEMGAGSIHFYGHVHGNYDNGGKSIDVGLETNNYQIYSLDEAFDKADARDVVIKDHHTAKTNYR